MVGLARRGTRPGGVLVLAERDGVSKLCRREGELLCMSPMARWEGVGAHTAAMTKD